MPVSSETTRSARHVLRSLCLSAALVAVTGLGLSACETTQITTRQAVPLPIQVQRVQVVYERGNVDRQTASVTNETEQKNQAKLFRFFTQALEKAIPDTLQARGIPTAFVVRDIDSNAPTVPVVAGTSLSHELRIRVIRNTQVCREVGLCSNQLTVRASVLAAGSAAVLWSTEIQEGPVQPLIIEQGRLDVLANNLAVSLAHVMRVLK